MSRSGTKVAWVLGCMMALVLLDVEWRNKRARVFKYLYVCVASDIMGSINNWHLCPDNEEPVLVCYSTWAGLDWTRG